MQFLPPPPCRQHFREKPPFQYPKVPLEAGAPPPQSFDASYAPAAMYKKVIKMT